MSKAAIVTGASRGIGAREPVRQIDAVLFDYGGVLTTPVKPSIESWLDAIVPESFSIGWCGLDGRRLVAEVRGHVGILT